MPPGYVLDLIPVELLGAIGVIAAGVWGVKKLVIPAWRRLRAIGRQVARFLDDWFGEPARPGVAARPGVMPRLESYDGRIEGVEGAMAEYRATQEGHTSEIAAVAEAVADIRYHVQPNHGGSSHDALMARVEGVAEQVGNIAAAQLAVVGAVDRLREDKERAHDEMLRRLAAVEQARIQLEPGEES